MKLNIITPYSRDLSYLKEIKKSIEALTGEIDVRWLIISQHRNYVQALDWSNGIETSKGFTIEILKGKDEESFFGNSYRNQGLDLIDYEDSLTYFLDDDNIIHPNFHDLINVFVESDFDAIFFSQLEPDGSISLQPSDIKVGGVDTAMLLVRTNIANKYRWVLDEYTADGIYASEIFQNEKCKIVYTPYCFYNFLKNKEVENIEVKQTTDLDKILLEYSDNYMSDKHMKNSIFTAKEGFKILQGDIVVEIGAGIGIFASVAFRNNAGKIICFEKRKKFFESLILNKPENCDAFNMEIGSGISKNVVDYEPVISHRLDYFYEMGIIERINFLKISTNNFHDVLIGAETMISLGLIDKIVFKSYDDSTSNMKNNEISDLLTQKKFILVREKHNGVSINFAKKISE
jgi:hypothetical protein